MHQYYEKYHKILGKSNLSKPTATRLTMLYIWGRITSLGITFVVTTGISISWGTELNLLGFVNA